MPIIPSPNNTKTIGADLYYAINADGVSTSTEGSKISMSSPFSPDSGSTNPRPNPSNNNNNNHNNKNNTNSAYYNPGGDAKLSFPPELVELKLEDVVSRSVLADKNTEKQIENIVKAFNTNNKKVAPKDVITTSWWRGSRLKPGYFAIYHKNQVPVITADHQNKIAKVFNFSPNAALGKVGIYSMNELHISAFGTHIVNVPNSEYARVTIGTAQEPKLLATGVHVVQDPTFKLVPATVKASNPHIQHNSIHIISVSPGMLAKVWMGVKAVLLPYRVERYVFNDPLFRLEGFETENSPLISHGNQHRVLIPSGKIGLIWVDNQAKLLEARTEPYIFHTSFFRVGAAEWIVDATEKAIIHGSIKRLLPVTGEVGVCYDAGQLFVVYPAEDGSPFIRDSPLFHFEGFLEVNISTEVFPSERTKLARKRENANATSDQINFEIVTTRDSLKLGVKLMISYYIQDATKLLRVLHRDEILTHIENVSTTDLARAIQRTTSLEFLTFSTPIEKEGKKEDSDQRAAPSAPSYSQVSFVDIVKNDLARDLKELGICLLRLSIESPKVLDAETSKSMEQQSLLLAQAAAQESVLDTQFRIAQTKANQEAAVKRIAQDQENAMLISAANAKLRAAEAEAQIVVIKAEAERKSADLRGRQYKEQPELYAMEMAKVNAQALTSASLQLIVTPEEMRHGLGSMLLAGFNPLNRANSK